MDSTTQQNLPTDKTPQFLETLLAKQALVIDTPLNIEDVQNRLQSLEKPAKWGQNVSREIEITNIADGLSIEITVARKLRHTSSASVKLYAVCNTIGNTSSRLDGYTRLGLNWIMPFGLMLVFFVGYSTYIALTSNLYVCVGLIIPFGMIALAIYKAKDDQQELIDLVHDALDSYR